MNEQLKPCPFCGGKPAIGQDDNIYLSGSSITSWSILCDGCDINLSCYSDVECITGWNSRADGWISAKSNPPKKSCQVIAEWSNGDVEQSSYITDWGKPHFQRKCGTDENGTGWAGNVGYVINWMLLPKATSCGE